jgi:NADH-quinone oxidoreductase subunit L
MLVGVLTIAGIPLFSGWYSKDSILAASLNFVRHHPEHVLLFALPLMTAGITTFYMFRMWFMTFTGRPRDHHVYEHAHESPWVMTVPLILLAFFSITVAWGWPIWQADASWLEHQIHHSAHPALQKDFGVIVDHDNVHDVHHLAGFLALAVVAMGIGFAVVLYYTGQLDPADAKEKFEGLHRFLMHKWYFDELYSAIIVRPGLAVAHWCRAFDTHAIDGFVNGFARANVTLSRWSGRFDKGIVDGLVNLLADVSYAIGSGLRGLQTGYIRSYVLFLVLAAVGIWVVLSFLMTGAVPAAGH